MDTTLQRRIASYDRAMQFSMATGITCPGCIFKYAKQVDVFLETGNVEAEHLGSDDEGVITFEPDDRSLN